MDNRIRHDLDKNVKEWDKKMENNRIIDPRANKTTFKKSILWLLKSNI